MSKMSELDIERRNQEADQRPPSDPNFGSEQVTNAPKKKKRKELERVNNLEGLVSFDLVGDNIGGIFRGVKDIRTSYGIKPFIILEDTAGQVTEKGDPFEHLVEMKSNLRYFDWEENRNNELEIERVGSERNPATGNKYYTFKVFILE